MPLLRFARRLSPGLTAPFGLPLDAHRASRVQGLLEAHPFIVELVQTQLQRLLQGPEPEAQRLIACYARVLLGELRREPIADPLLALAARCDAVVRSERGELLDRAWIPALVKRLEMVLLDRVNRNLGSYDTWAGEVVESLAGLASAHVMDLAAGSGGFALHVAKHPPDGTALRWTVTDREPAYVRLGRQQGRKLGVPIDFDVRDALDLRDLQALSGPGRVDLFICTQSTHHLTPGQLVRLFSQAMAAAEHGILVVDLFRSAVNVLGAALATTLTAPFLPLQLDGMQSIRRSYTPAELSLLARLAGASQVTARTVAPAFAVLHASR